MADINAQIAEAEKSLANADAAGDTEAAKAIVGEIQRLDALRVAEPAPAEAEPSGFVPSVKTGFYGAIEGMGTAVQEGLETQEGFQKPADAPPSPWGEAGPAAFGTPEEAAARRQNTMTWAREGREELDFVPAGRFWDDPLNASIQAGGGAVGSLAAMGAAGPFMPIASYMMNTGEIINEIGDVQGLSRTDRYKIASAAGVPLAALDSLGLGAIFGKFAKGVGGKVLTGAATEAATEILQELGIISVSAWARDEDITKKVWSLDTADRLLKSGVGGVGASMSIQGAIGLPLAVGSALGQSVNNMDAQAIYGDNADKMLSDQRVADAFDRKVAGMEEAGTAGDTKPAWVLRTVARDLADNIRDTTSALYDTNVFTDADKKAVDAVILRARQGVDVIEQADFDTIADLNVDPEVSKVLMNAVRDLNTATAASRDNRTQGPLQSFMRGEGRGISGAGLMIIRATPVAKVLIGGSLETAGRMIDSVMGTRNPRVLRGAEARKRLIERAGAERIDTGSALKDLYKMIKAGEPVAAPDRLNAMAEGNKLRANLRRTDDTGTGSFDRLIANETGYSTRQVDEGLMTMLLANDITIDQHAQFYAAPESLMEGKQGLRMMDMLKRLRLEPEGIKQPTQLEEGGRVMSGGEARRLASYNAQIRHAEVARDRAYDLVKDSGLPPAAQQHIAGVATEMVAMDQKSEKLAIMTTALQGMTGPAKKAAERILTPLTKFGALSEETAAKIEKAVKE